MEDRTSRSRKQKIRLIAGLFVVLLAACSLAGNSLRALSLPKVYTTTASLGSVTHDYEGSATIQPGEVRDIANPAGWKVSKVLVKQGERVRLGQPLIEYDDGDALQQLSDLQTGLKKLDLSMNLLHANYVAAANGGDESAKIAAGAAIETAKLDIATQQRHIQNLEKSIAEDRQAAAPFDGIVTNVNAAPGLGSGGGPDISVSNAAKGYRIHLLVPGEIASLLGIGETLDRITLSGPESRQLSGMITAIEEETSSGSPEPSIVNGSDSISSEAAPSSVTVTVTGKGLQGGERVQVKISKSGAQQSVTVPNEAVHQDERGNYVYTLRADEGPLGNAYYAVETPVKIADSNAYVTAISDGLFEQEEVILHSTGFLVDGVRVRR